MITLDRNDRTVWAMLRNAADDSAQVALLHQGPLTGLGVRSDDGAVARSTVVPVSSFARFQFPPDVILLAVR